MVPSLEGVKHAGCGRMVLCSRQAAGPPERPVPLAAVQRPTSGGTRTRYKLQLRVVEGAAGGPSRPCFWSVLGSTSNNLLLDGLTLG